MLPDSLYSSYNNTIVDSAYLKKIVPLKDTFISPSFFNNHLLNPLNNEPVIHFPHNDYVPAILLFIVFSLFVWLFGYNKNLKNKIGGFFSIAISSGKSSRDDNSQLSRSMIFLSFIFLILFTLFIGETIRFNNAVFKDDYGILLIQIACAIVLIYAIKILAFYLLGFIFNTKKEVREYSSTLILFWNSLAIFLFPIVVCMLFVKQISPYYFIISGVVGIALFMMLRTIRIILAGVNNIKISKLYLFLYLCTLEILPLAILYKLFLIAIPL